MQPLLTGAINFLATYNVPPQQVRTSVLATGGMRLIAESTQTAIYQSVTNTIIGDGLILGDVGTISGQNEAVYSWSDVNYLQNNFSANQTTNGIVEVGGASAQVAFTSSGNNANIVPVTINSQVYDVYAVSFLGLGQKEANRQMKALNSATQQSCYPAGSPENLSGAFSLSTCTSNYAAVTNSYGESLSTIYQQPNFDTQNFIGLSSIYFALNFWNITQQPMSLVPSIMGTCNLPWMTLQGLYPNDAFLSAQCATSSYVNQFLYGSGSLRLGSNQLTSLNEVNGTSLTWTLGYLLVSLYK